MKKLTLFLIALAMILTSCKPEVEKPTVITKFVGEVTETTAKVVGQVTADGGAEVTERGICWSTDGTPTILDYRVKDVEGGLGSYEVFFTDLVPNTQYYVRAYATNESGTGYGDEKIFVTLGDEPEEVAPTVTTAEVTNITVNSALCGGEVTFDGNVTVTARGICWSTNQNPTIDDNKTTNGEGVGSFTSQIPDLVPNTQYYVRAYATNEVGTAYGEEKCFTTLPIEGTTNGHSWVDLGLPSGLKWATYNVGATSPEEYGDYFAWGETSTKAEYNSDNSPTYGLSISELQSQGYIDGEGNLTSQYDAATANCGGSWRMPTYDELYELSTKCTWTWTTQNSVNGYKVIGPSGASIFLPTAGCRDGSSLIGAGIYGRYWSSTPDEDNDDYACRLFFNVDGHGMNDYGRNYGLSVRPILE